MRARCVQTFYEEISQKCSMNALEELVEKRGRQLARLLELCMFGLKLKPFFYYSSLCTINRIIDRC